MSGITTVLATFLAALAGAIAVALLIRLFGKRPDYASAVAIAVGVTIPSIVRLVWPVTDSAYSAILGVSVGLSFYCGRLVHNRRHA